MKKVFALCLFALGIPGLPLSSKATEGEASDASAKLKELPGMYAGQLGRNKVRIWIQKIEGETMSGVTFMKGNERPFSGPFSLAEKDGVTEVTATEPPTYPTDGTFKIRYQLGTPTLTGAWISDDPQKAQTISFQLSRREFHYDPKVGKFPECSSRLLKKADVENRSQGELWRMRDEIYARHGLSFNPVGSFETFAYFQEQDWYLPVSKDVRAEITDIENQNLDLIGHYVHHEKMFSRRFGR